MAPPTRSFTDRIYRCPRGSFEMVATGNGEWAYRVGTWYGRFLGRAAMVKIVDWPASSTKEHGVTLMTLIWGDREFLRRWPDTFTDRKLAQLAREFCEDAQAGAVGAQ